MPEEGTDVYANDSEELDMQIVRIQEARKEAGINPLTLTERENFKQGILSQRHSQRGTKNYEKSIKDLPDIREVAKAESAMFMPSTPTRMMNLSYEGVPYEGLGNLSGAEALRRSKEDVVNEDAANAVKAGVVAGLTKEALSSKIKEAVKASREALNGVGSKIAKAGVAAEKVIGKVAHAVDIEGHAIEAAKWAANKVGGAGAAEFVGQAGNRALGLHPASMFMDMIPTPAIIPKQIPMRDENGNFVLDEKGEIVTTNGPALINGGFEMDHGSYWDTYSSMTSGEPQSWQEKNAMTDPYGVSGPVGEFVGNLYGATKQGASLEEAAKLAVQEARRTTRDPEMVARRQRKDEEKFSIYGHTIIPAIRDYVVYPYLRDDAGEKELINSDTFRMYTEAMRKEGK